MADTRAHRRHSATTPDAVWLEILDWPARCAGALMATATFTPGSLGHVGRQSKRH